MTDDAAKSKDNSGAWAPCPRCGTELDARSAGRAKLFACRTCGGVWLSKDAAQIVIAHVQGSLPIVIASEKASRAAAAPAAAPTRTARCPWDGEPLGLVEIEGVKVDVCPVHGTWFDAGEVRLIANASTVNEPSRARAASSKSEAAAFDLGAFIDCLSDAIDQVD